MKYNLTSRRMFLQGAGAALAIPFLPSVVRAQVTAATDLRFILMPFSQGTARSRLWPTNKTVPFTQLDTYTKSRLLKDVMAANGGKISEIFDATWASYADKMNIITGLNLYASTVDHRPLAPGCATTNYAGAKYSIDHCIRESWMKKGYAPKLPYLAVVIGRQTNPGDYQEWNYGTGGGKAYPVIDTIQKMETTVFGSQTGSANQTSQKKLVDAVLGDYQKLMNDRRISSVDKSRLSDAMDQWNDIQKASAAPGTCAFPPTVGAAVDFGVQNRQAIDLIVACLNCNLIRVASQTIVTVGDTDPGREALHEIAHAGLPYLEPFKWKIALLKRYADQLSTLKDMNGEPLLNSTVLFHSTEYSDFGNHSTLGRSIVTLGSARGKIKTGLHISAGGSPYQRVHIGMMRALGLTDSEIELNGQPGFGEYVASTENYYEDGPDARYLLTDSSKFTTDVEKRKGLPGLV